MAPDGVETLPSSGDFTVIVDGTYTKKVIGKQVGCSFRLFRLSTLVVDSRPTVTRLDIYAYVVS